MTDLGIDFGTTNSSMARMRTDDRRAEIVRDGDGREKTPSVVYFGEDETLVGAEAMTLVAEARAHPEVQARLIQSVKRNLLQPVIALPDGRIVRPVEVVARILAKLKTDAEETAGSVRKAVITCPAAFDAAQASTLVEAAGVAGFDEVELIEEPVAAAIAFEHEGGQVGHGVLVYDYGGGTFDVAFVVREPGADSFALALEPDGDAERGGDDLDQILYDHFDAQVRRELGRPLSGREEVLDLEFLRTCRRRKESLSKSRHATFSTMIAGGVPFRAAIDRAGFDRLIADHVERTITISERMATRAGQAGYLVDTVLLVGGSSQLPLVQRRIMEALGVAPQKWGHRDVAVALGAAYYAHTLWGSGGGAPPLAPEESYRRSVALVWSDGRLESTEADRLDAVRRELGLSPETAATIERTIMGRTKEELLGREVPASDLAERDAEPVSPAPAASQPAAAGAVTSEPETESVAPEPDAGLHAPADAVEPELAADPPAGPEPAQATEPAPWWPAPRAPTTWAAPPAPEGWQAQAALDARARRPPRWPAPQRWPAPRPEELDGESLI